MHSEPRVTVLMPVYNAEAYLAETVESVLGQTFRDFEFLIINDGSTDGSQALLERYAAADPRIRLINQENRGQVPTMNAAIDMARAPLIARIDADDVALPNRLDVQVAYMDAHPDCVLIGCGFWLIDGQSRVIGLSRMGPMDNAALQAELLQGRNYLCHPTVLFRRAVCQDVGGYDAALSLAEDLDLWLRMGEVGEVALLGDVLMAYRQHGGSLSATKQDRQLTMVQESCARAYARRGIDGTCAVTAHWLPDTSRSSRRLHAVRYGWGAFNHGHWRTAAAYGVEALRLCPWDVEAWRLVACAVAKRPVHPPVLPPRAKADGPH